MSLSALIESILFWKGEPVTIKDLAKILSKKREEIEEALKELEASLSGRGVSLIRNGDEVMLHTSKDSAEIIEKLTKEELSRDISKAGLEVLSLVLYRGPISKRDIDYVRGVNSSYILRNLLIRGLIDRIDNPTDARTFLYKPTFELLSFLGIHKPEDLPEFNEVISQIEEFNKQEKTEDENG